MSKWYNDRGYIDTYTHRLAHHLRCTHAYTHTHSPVNAVHTCPARKCFCKRKTIFVFGSPFHTYTHTLTHARTYNPVYGVWCEFETIYIDSGDLYHMHVSIWQIHAIPYWTSSLNIPQSGVCIIFVSPLTGQFELIWFANHAPTCGANHEKMKNWKALCKLAESHVTCIVCSSFFRFSLCCA